MSNTLFARSKAASCSVGSARGQHKTKKVVPSIAHDTDGFIRFDGYWGGRCDVFAEGGTQSAVLLRHVSANKAPRLHAGGHTLLMWPPRQSGVAQRLRTAGFDIHIHTLGSRKGSKKPQENGSRHNKCLRDTTNYSFRQPKLEFENPAMSRPRSVT